MQFSIELQADNVRRLLEALAQNLSAPNDILESVGQALLPVNEQRHKDEVAPDGTPWAPLAPATLRKKSNPRMLVEHGDMLRFFNQVEGDSVEIGTVDRKAIWHHEGTVRRPPRWLVMAGLRNDLEHSKRGLPARPLVGFPESDQELATAVIEDNLRVILRGAL